MVGIVQRLADFVCHQRTDAHEIVTKFCPVKLDIHVAQLSHVLIYDTVGVAEIDDFHTDVIV
jgi:hypothetical protein